MEDKKQMGTEAHEIYEYIIDKLMDISDTGYDNEEDHRNDISFIINRTISLERERTLNEAIEEISKNFPAEFKKDLVIRYLNKKLKEGK